MTEEQKEKIRNLKDTEDWYVCKECGEIGVAPKEDFAQTVAARKNICLDCIYKRDKERKKPTAKKAKHLEYCEVCGKPFMTIKARTCGDKKCISKLAEKTTFYKNLAKANKEVDASKVHVFGQGNFPVSVYDKQVVKGLKKNIDNDDEKKEE